MIHVLVESRLKSSQLLSSAGEVESLPSTFSGVVPTFILHA